MKIWGMLFRIRQLSDVLIRVSYVGCFRFWIKSLSKTDLSNESVVLHFNYRLLMLLKITPRLLLFCHESSSSLN